MKSEQSKEQTKNSSIRVPISLYNQLVAEADRQDRTVHSLMIHALREYMRGRAADTKE